MPWFAKKIFYTDLDDLVVMWLMSSLVSVVGWLTGTGFRSVFLFFFVRIGSDLGFFLRV